MIEKIDTSDGKFISKANPLVLSAIDKVMEQTASLVSIAEVGVGIGATAVEIVKRLRVGDCYYFFSHEDDVNELYDDLKATPYCKCDLVPKGCSRKMLDSYNWQLAKMALALDDEHPPIFDVAYLDGAHALAHDGLACVLLKMLIKPGGYLVVDDLNWSYAHHISLFPESRDSIMSQYTEEQAQTAQVEMVTKLFLERDPQWQYTEGTHRQAVFQKAGVV